MFSYYIVVHDIRNGLVDLPELSPPALGILPKEEPVLHPLHIHPRQPSSIRQSPPTALQQQRYLIPNTAGMVPAPAHIGFIPSSQSHVSAHPLPAHLPTFLQQGATPFAVNPSQATYLTQAGMIGSISAAARGTARQPAFPSYLYSSYE